MKTVGFGVLVRISLNEVMAIVCNPKRSQNPRRASSSFWHVHIIQIRIFYF